MMNRQRLSNNRFDIGRSATPMTLRLIIINVLMWLAQLVWHGRMGFDLTDRLGLHYMFSDAFGLWQWFSHMFLHSTHGAQHLLFNMYALWLFGSVIERYWGAIRYLYFYLACGVSAALLQQVVWAVEFIQIFGSAVGLPATVQPFLNLPLGVGASGAIFGLLLAFGMIFPNRELFLFPLPFPIKAKYMVIGYGLLELYLGLHPSPGSNVGHFAHLGGMIGGYILIRLWRSKGRIGGGDG
ncbi:MAG: rhomboid family intramembrane serine protease [Porphyromonadaceae bacterium]|nr:rhomboid family intramembrane serine protease [Porphyromonadaceae bacterium]